MFPRLSPAQLARVAERGARRQVARGEIVAEQGDSRPRFFVVLSGALSIVHPDGNEEVLIQNLGVGEFSGEVNMLSARPSLVRARMTAAGELLVIDSDDLRRVVQSDAELSE